jgi:hypothetical protein
MMIRTRAPTIRQIAVLLKDLQDTPTAQRSIDNNGGGCHVEHLLKHQLISPLGDEDHKRYNDYKAGIGHYCVIFVRLTLKGMFTLFGYRRSHSSDSLKRIGING